MNAALHLDYKRDERQHGLAAWTVAATALAFAAVVGNDYATLRAQVVEKEARLAKLATSSGSPALQQVKSVTPDEIAFARDTIRRLTTPWRRLFSALEAAQTSGVALLSIEPDSEGRTVNVTGEAKDYLATLTYVGHLNEEPALKRVHLVRHEARDGSDRPVVFTVSAAWRHVR